MENGNSQFFTANTSLILVEYAQMWQNQGYFFWNSCILTSVIKKKSDIKFVLDHHCLSTASSTEVLSACLWQKDITDVILFSYTILVWVSSMYLAPLCTIKNSYWKICVKFYSLIAFCLVRVCLLHCLSVRLHNGYTRAHVQIKQNVHTRIRQWMCVWKPKSYSLVEGNQTIRSLFSLWHMPLISGIGVQWTSRSLTTFDTCIQHGVSYNSCAVGAMYSGS